VVSDLEEAIFSYHRAYNTQSRSLSESLAREDCWKQSSEACVGGSITIFGLKVGGKQCLRNNQDSCQGLSIDSKSEDESSEKTVSIITTGSKPVEDLEKWVNSGLTLAFREKM